MKRAEHRVNYYVVIFLIAFITYFLTDVPIRLTRAFDFPPQIGIKSFLPFSMGMVFGPVGAAGCAVGALLSSLIFSGINAAAIAEVICVILCGIGMWTFWFALNRTGNIRLERGRDLLVYTALVAGLSILCGAIASALIDRSIFLPVMGGYMISGMLVSCLVIILLGGIFCVAPIYPPWCRVEPDVEILLTPDMAGTAVVNDAIEEQALKKKIQMKRVFEVESCLEELFIRIRQNLPEATIRGRIDLGSTISMQIRMAGTRYDPLRLKKDEDELDVISLKLIRHRALRASYSYRDRENRIHIVV